MFISEEEAKKRLNSKDNIALKFMSALDDPRDFSGDDDPSIAEEDDDTEEDDDDLGNQEPERNPPEEDPEDLGLPPVEEPDLVRSLPEQSDKTKGRSKGDTNLPSFMREIIGTTAHFDTAKHVAEVFGVSKSSVNAYKQGQTSLSNPNTANSQELKKKVKGNLDAINDLAMQKLMLSLGLITADKLKVAGVRDISTVAANVSRVLSATNPDRGGLAAVNVIFYSPNQRKEADYESVTVRDNQ